MAFVASWLFLHRDSLTGISNILSSSSFRTGAHKEAARAVLAYVWDVYSMPSPVGKDVFTLMSLCLAFVAITGGLLYHWLANTLKYHAESSIGIACFYSALMFLVAFLCHPVRCVLTIALPTVCTKQGRKLLITASVMVLVLNVIPNITVNVGAAAGLLKCTAEGFARTLLNSTDPLNRAKSDLIRSAINSEKNQTIVKTMTKFDQSNNIDLSEVRGKLAMVLGSIKDKAKDARDLFGWCKLLSNRIFAGFFVALLTLECLLYLKSYLTILHFDNNYTSKDLQKKVEDQKKRKRFNVKGQECSSSLVTVTLVTLHFIVITIIVVLDHVVFYVVQAILPWLLDFPATSATLSVDYKVIQPENMRQLCPVTSTDTLSTFFLCLFVPRLIWPILHYGFYSVLRYRKPSTATTPGPTTPSRCSVT